MASRYELNRLCLAIRDLAIKWRDSADQTELRAQGPDEKRDDQDGHDKCPVRTELQCNKHQLRSNRPARQTDCQIVLAAKGNGLLSTPRVARWACWPTTARLFRSDLWRQIMAARLARSLSVVTKLPGIPLLRQLNGLIQHPRHPEWTETS